MGGMQLTDTVKHLLIINIIVFFLVQGYLQIPLAVYYPGYAAFKPFQIVTHMFAHANTSHLFFNMFSLFIFGPMVEHRLGTKHFFKLYFIAGFGALALHLATKYIEIHFLGAPPELMQIPMLGASGALMGVVAAFATLFPNIRVQLLIPPIPMKAKHMALLFIGLDLWLGIGRYSTGVAHFAHVGCAIIGYLYVTFFAKGNFRIN